MVSDITATVSGGKCSMRANIASSTGRSRLTVHTVKEHTGSASHCRSIWILANGTASLTGMIGLDIVKRRAGDAFNSTRIISVVLLANLTIGTCSRAKQAKSALSWVLIIARKTTTISANKLPEITTIARFAC